VTIIQSHFPLDEGVASSAAIGYQHSTYRSRESLVRTARAKLDQLGQLKDGWDGDRSRAPEFVSLYVGHGLIQSVVRDNGPTPQITPTPDGGVVVDWLVGGRSVSVLVGPDGHADVLAEDGAGRTEFDGDYPWRAPDQRLIERLAAYLDSLAEDLTVRVRSA
jgi:hypothetical protein